MDLITSLLNIFNSFRLDLFVINSRIYHNII